MSSATSNLLATILLPLFGGLALLVIRWPAAVVRQIALVVTTVTLLISIVLAIQFQKIPAPAADAHAPIHSRLDLRHDWMTLDRHLAAKSARELHTDLNKIVETVHLEFYLGMDGISLSLVVLTSLLTFSAVLISWNAVHDRLREYFASLLILEGALSGAFCAFDLILFYVFFEFSLLPLFFLVGVWGGPKRREAAVKFFLYTFAGSVVTLTGLVILLIHLLGRNEVAHPFSIPDIAAVLVQHPLPYTLQVGVFLAISLGFAIKVPLFPFHTWLPLAHVEAPTAGSVLLAGVLLKLGAYGFLRFCLPFVPDACLSVGVPLIGTLSVIGILYGALCAYAQTDLKKLVAYSSISHLGFCMLGMFALNAEGLTGSFLQIINHGLSTGALFLIVGMVYERYHTREIPQFGGLASKLPLISTAMVFTCLASIGLPGLNGFVGEFLSLIGMFRVNAALACVGTLGVILAAIYLLTMLQKAFFGPVGAMPQSHPVPDMGGREAWSVLPLLALCLVLGVYPKPLIDLVKPDIEGVAGIYSRHESEPIASASVVKIEARR
jgi:NADH-quinone oxidoreductase subunit M